MTDFAARLGASKAASTLVVLYIPSKDRSDKPIDQTYWVNEAFTGGGAFGMARLTGLNASIQNSARSNDATGKQREEDSRVAISEETRRRLERLAELASTGERKVSPMQVASQLLEAATARLTEAAELVQRE